MRFHVKVLKDVWGSLEVVLYKEGEFTTPLCVMDYNEFLPLYREAKAQAKDFKGNTKLTTYDEGD